MSEASDTPAGRQLAGVVPLDLVAQEGGLSVMQGILDGRLPGAAMAKTLNFWLSKVEEGDLSDRETDALSSGIGDHEG